VDKYSELKRKNKSFSELSPIYLIEYV